MEEFEIASEVKLSISIFDVFFDLFVCFRSELLI